jgi:outer membrane protease
MMRIRSLFIAAAAAGMLAAGVAAEPAPTDAKFLNGRLWGGLGVMSGDVTYQIGGHATNPSVDYWFPLSELRWPLGVTVLTLGAELPLSANLDACAAVAKNISTGAGKMKDSDWLNGADPSQKTIYSESDTALQSFTADVDLRGWVARGTVSGGVTNGFAVGGGLLYQRF